MDVEVNTLGPRGAYRITRRDGEIIGVEVWPDVQHPGTYAAVTEAKSVLTVQGQAPAG